MSDQPKVNLKALLEEADLLDKAVKLEDTLYELRWGSALVIVGIKGPAMVAIAPMFNKLPDGAELAFLHRLLELNATLGGMAGFAIQPDGWIVLHGGRDVKGMDADEFALVVSTVARHADQFDDQLYDEFFRTEEAENPPDGAEESESGGSEDAG